MKTLTIYAVAALMMTLAYPAFAESDTASDSSAPPAALDAPDMTSPGVPVTTLRPHGRTVTTTRTTTYAHGIVPDATTDIIYVPADGDLSVGAYTDADVMADLANPGLIGTETVIIEEPAPVVRHVRVIH